MVWQGDLLTRCCRTLRLFALNVGGEFFAEMGWDARLKVDLVALVVFLIYLAYGADSGQGLAVGLRDGE